MDEDNTSYNQQAACQDYQNRVYSSKRVVFGNRERTSKCFVDVMLAHLRNQNLSLGRGGDSET